MEIKEILMEYEKGCSNTLSGKPSDCCECLQSAINAIISQTSPKVKPLEWEDHPLNGAPVLSQAITQIGTYFICDDTDDFSGFYLELVTHDNAQWWQHVRAITEHLIGNHHDDDLTPLKAAAHADYERRILSALE